MSKIPYAKPALTIAQQIAQLRKRGMVFNDTPWLRITSVRSIIIDTELRRIYNTLVMLSYLMNQMFSWRLKNTGKLALTNRTHAIA